MKEREGGRELGREEERKTKGRKEEEQVWEVKIE